MKARLSILCSALVLATIPAVAQKFYDPDITSIIDTHGCANCHGGSGGLFVTPYTNIMSTGDHGPVVVANDSASVIVLKLKGTATFGARMPFGGPYLSAAEINTVVQWILGGAKEKATTAVAQNTGSPSEFSLLQNFPNPSNPSTQIGYAVPGGNTDLVRLSVLDLLGREVALLVNERKSPGTYSVTFPAAGLPSGTYLYRMTAGSFVQTRKMVIVK
jgi:hypothetical protein